jgi:hypothetical protein
MINYLDITERNIITFVIKDLIKMAQAKKLQYEALKEVLPEKAVQCLEKLEGEILDCGKEYFVAMMKDMQNDSQNTSSEKESGVRKVTIE